MKAYPIGTRTNVRQVSLGKLTFLAEGRFGRVFRAERFRLPGDRTPLAFKELTIDRAAQVAAAVALRDGMSPADRAELDQYCAWPRALVEDAPGNVSGFLMPAVPAQFRARQADPGSRAVVARPRALSWLTASAAQRSAARVELPEVGETERLILLAHLVYAIGRLHAHGWVYGDLSLARAAFAADPPRLMLLGCDGAAPLADPGRSQSSTPGWEPPENAAGSADARQDTVTDAYKLGLAILRVLVPGAGDAPGEPAGLLPGELDPVGADLVTRALSADRARRPTAKDLYGYLYRVVACRTAARAPVTVSLGGLARPQVPALEAFCFDPMTAAFAGRLSTRVSGPGPLRVPPVRALDLVESMRPDRLTPMAAPRLDEAIAATSGALQGLIQNEGQRYVASLRRARLGGGNDQANG